MRPKYSGVEEPARNTTMCVAFGCPLLGGIADSTQGSDRWLCRFHFGHEAREFDAITTEVRRRQRDGELSSTAQTPTVAAMKAALKVRE